MRNIDGPNGSASAGPTTYVLSLEAYGHDAHVALSQARRSGTAAVQRVLARTHTPGLLTREMPWCAELVGRDTRYQPQYQRMTSQVSYVDANGVGSRGVYFYYHLRSGPIYAVFAHESWRRSRHYHLTVSDGGDPVEVGIKEVSQWLDGIR